MSKENRFPIDFDSLKKGDIIPIDRIEHILSTDGKNIRKGTTAYDLGLMALCARIESEIHERGNIWTVKSEKGTVKILTDDEAALYNHALQQQARNSELRRFGLQQAVDVSQLTPEVRKQHERNLEIDGKYIQAMVGVKATLRLKAENRRTPGLPPPS